MHRSAFASPLLALFAAFLASSAHGQLAISSNDGKVTLVNGVPTMPATIVPDTIAILDLAANKVVAEIEVPGSFMGPPSNVAISPDGKVALVSSSYKISPADPKTWVPDNRLTVVDLSASPPKVVSTIECGAAPSGVSFNKAGTLALVANRSDGTLSVLKVSGSYVTRIGTVTVGAATSGPSHVAFTPDGKMALVTKDGSENAVSVLAIDGETVTYNKRDLFPGVRPYGLVITPDGKTAVVGLVGRGAGDNDAIASIDLTGKWPRVAEHLTVGQTPESVSMSADGKWVAVSVINGSNKAKDWPWYATHGKAVLVRVDGTKLTKVSEAPVGAWVQGTAFSGDGRKLFAQNLLENRLQVLDIDANGQMRDSGSIPLKASPVGIRVHGAP